MRTFLHRRAMTWALLLWSAYVGAWTVITGSGPALLALWWLVGTIVVASLWLAATISPARP